MSNGVNQCAACGGLWDDDEPHAVCPSDPSPDPTDEAVALLKSIGLDITYTDEGLRVVARRIMALGVDAEIERRAAGEAAIQRWYPDWNTYHHKPNPDGAWVMYVDHLGQFRMSGGGR